MLAAVGVVLRLRKKATERGGDKVSPIVSVVLILTMSACSDSLSSPRELVKPKDVSVAKALEDIGKGFNLLGSELDGAVLGVLPCKVTMTLVVKASATDDNTLAIGVSEAPILIVEKSVQSDKMGETESPGFGAVGTLEEAAEASRDNTIVIEMYNPGCLPKNTLGYDKPNQVAAAMRGMLVTDEMARRHVNILGYQRKVLDTVVQSQSDVLKGIADVEKPGLPGG